MTTEDCLNLIKQVGEEIITEEELRQLLETKKNVDFVSKQKNKLFEVLEKLAIRGSVRNLRSYYWKDLLHMYRDGKSRSTPCPFLKDQFVIDSFGDVYYCLSERPIGNFRGGKRISDIYYDKDNLQFLCPGEYLG